MKKCELRPPFDTLWAGKDPFREAAGLQGEEFRHVKNRRTFRIELAGSGFFVKQHSGSGWGEIFKNLTQCKLPVLGAGNEYRALQRLSARGIDTMEVAAFGQKGWFPTRKNSFLITRELTGCISLEDWVREKRSAVERLHVLRALAGAVRGMHCSGINHRDCYLCHFLLKKETIGLREPMLFIIDLHRAQLRTKVPFRYRVKDVAGIFFSSMDSGLTRREVFRFMRFYSGIPLKRTLRRDRRFWRSVYRAAYRLYRKEFQKEAPPLF